MSVWEFLLKILFLFHKDFLTIDSLCLFALHLYIQLLSLFLSDISLHLQLFRSMG